MSADVLLEDFPGTGKTSLARAISETVEGVIARLLGDRMRAAA